MEESRSYAIVISICVRVVPVCTVVKPMCMTEEYINKQIKENKLDTNKISDGYHTFGELYEHRIALFLTLCSWMYNSDYCEYEIWRSKKHHDGSTYDGWFIAGIGTKKGEQISYHLPMKYWDMMAVHHTYRKAPEWDGHTPADVVKRLLQL